jgi:uncharacterized protein (DUF924 family)
MAATPAADDARAAAVLSYWFGGDDYKRVASDRLSWPPAEVNKRWFFGGKEVDDEIRARFLPLLDELAATAEGDGNDAKSARRWLDADLEASSSSSCAESLLPLRALAGIVAMDQFSRNAFRGTPRAFALDAEALRWSRALVGRGLHRRLAPAARLFVLLPFEHAECLETQRESVELFKEMLADAEKAAAAAAAGARGEEAAATTVVSNARSTLEFAEKHLAVIEKWGRFPGRNAALGRESTTEEAEGLASGAIARW